MSLQTLKVDKLYLPTAVTLAGAARPSAAWYANGIRDPTVVADDQVIPLQIILEPDTTQNISLSPSGYIEITESGLYQIQHQIYATKNFVGFSVGAKIGTSDLNSTVPTMIISESASANSVFIPGIAIAVEKTVLLRITQPTRIYLMASTFEDETLVSIHELESSAYVVVSKIN